MDEKKIRKIYQRDDPEDKRGLNKGAIDNMIKMLEVHENSTDFNVKKIAQNFEVFETLAPNFTIFESKDEKNCFLMPKFNALQIGKDSDTLISSHEFGHFILNSTTGVNPPENFGEIISKAKEHALDSKNKETFKAYIEFLCKYGKEEATAAEKGPVSDIISSIFQRQAFRIGTAENICVLPGSHKREYYTKDGTNNPNLKTIYDEDFANFYALKANNCKKEIGLLKSLFGEELIQTLENQLELSSGIIMQEVEKNKAKGPNLRVEEIITSDKEILDEKNKIEEDFSNR